MSWQSHDARSVGVMILDFQMIIALQADNYLGALFARIAGRTPGPPVGAGT
jgi:hypothetical protein